MLYGYTGSREVRTWNGGRTESNIWELDADRGVCAYKNEDGTMTIEFGSGMETSQVVLDCIADGKVFASDGRADELWRFGRPRGEYQHPTQKPVCLVERALQNSSRIGDIVVDFFGGSGTTLIACERTGRACRMSELDPKYVDVIVKRWESFSGKKAMLRRG
jgi:DNA modification methylase